MSLTSALIAEVSGMLDLCLDLRKEGWEHVWLQMPSLHQCQEGACEKLRPLLCGRQRGPAKLPKERMIRFNSLLLS